MFHKRSFKLFAALGAVAIVVAFAISTGVAAPQTSNRGSKLSTQPASQPSHTTPLDLHERHPGLIAYQQSDSVTSAALRRVTLLDQQTRNAIQTRWLAQHGHDNRTCVLLCGGQ